MPFSWDLEPVHTADCLIPEFHEAPNEYSSVMFLTLVTLFSPGLDVGAVADRSGGAAGHRGARPRPGGVALQGLHPAATVTGP